MNKYLEYLLVCIEGIWKPNLTAYTSLQLFMTFLNHWVPDGVWMGIGM